MAFYFVNSVDGVGGAGDGSSWANAYLTIAAALARPISAGDSLWVGSNHAESTASAVTHTYPGTAASPNFVYCVDHTKASPGSGDLLTTGSVATTGASALNINGSVYINGLILFPNAALNCASGTNNNVTLENCTLKVNGSCTIPGLNGRCLFINTTIQFAGDQVVSPSGRLVWKKTPALIQGTPPATRPFTVNGGASIFFEGIDFSAVVSGKLICDMARTGSNNCSVIFKDCKIASGAVIATNPTAQGPGAVVTRTDSAGTNYIEQIYQYAGTQIDETTIVRTGGASDGTTAKSRKIVTTANSRWTTPFESDPIAIWNESTSPITTLTVYGTTAAGGVPNDDDIWIDVEYLGSSTSPLGSFITSSKANNLVASAAVNNSSDSSTWGGAGAGHGFKIVCPSFTPAQKGYIYIYVRAAKATSTFYIDPKIGI